MFNIFKSALFLASLICTLKGSLKKAVHYATMKDGLKRQCTKKRAYGRCSRREIKGNEISTEPVLHNGSQPCHIPGANICLNGVEPFGKTLTFLRKKGGKLDDDVPYSFFHWRQAPFGCFAPCQEKCVLSPSCNNLCSALLSPFFAIPHYNLIPPRLEFWLHNSL